MMNRLIDTMTDAAIDEYISYLSYVNQRLDSPRQKLEKLFAPAPHWSDNLDVAGNTQHLLILICGIRKERIHYEMFVMQRSTERL